LITAKCNKCWGTATGDTFAEASKNINHAVGLSRGIKCGDNYNMVCEIKDSTPEPQKPVPTPPKEPTPTRSKEFPPTRPKDSTEKPKPTKSKK